MNRALLLSAWLLAAIGAVAVPVRVATFNVELGMDAPGTAQYEAVKAVLARVDPDVVAFQELNLDTLANWQALAAELGYGHVVLGASTPTMSGGLRVGYFSRHPVLSSFAIQSPPGANELTRSPLRLVVAVPDAVRPLVLWTMHHKAQTTETDQFRRAIEALRIVQDIDAYRAQNPDHTEFVLLGDLNADVFTESQTVAFSSLPGGLPPSYSLGSDVTFPVLYRVFPDERYGPVDGGLTRLDAFQQGSISRVTFVSRPPATFNSTLDYILVSDALLTSPAGAPQAEVYNSERDVLTGGAGLPKAGAIPPATASRDASDHYLVFADLHMEDAGPDLTAFPIRATGAYAQDFNTLPAGGSPTWTDNQTIPHWYAQRTGTGNTIVANDGSSNAGNLYSFGTGTSTDRALGSIGSGNAAAGHFAWGVVFRNTTSESVTLNTLSYVGEQWRNSGATAQTVAFSYRISALPITNMSPNSDDGWTRLMALDFTSPVAGGTAGPLDGNLAANRVRLSAVLGITLEPGEYIAFRWRDDDHPGADHGLAIDDFALDWTVGTPPLGRFLEWSGGTPPTPELVLRYAIGGAADIDHPSQPPQLSIEDGWLTLTAIIRTDDPDLAVSGQKAATPADFAVPGAVAPLPGVTAGDQSGVPAGCQRREYHAPVGPGAPAFLRLEATLAGAEE